MSSPKRITRWLGLTEARGFLLPVAQSVLIGVVFVSVLLAGYHDPQPHHAPVEVVGPPAQVAAVTRAVEAADPGAFDLRVVASSSESMDALRHGSSFGVLVLGTDPVLHIAGANGPTVTASLVGTFTPVVASQGLHLRLQDDVPLGANDAAGLPLFYLVFGVVLASYLFAVASVSLGRSLPARGHWASALLLAVLLAPAAALLVRYGTETITAHALIVTVLLGLLSLSVGAGTALCLWSWKTLGSLLATIVLVTLGTASGGALPAQWLPPWLGVLRSVLPMGVALDGIRGAVYFGAADVGYALAVLALWVVLPIALIQLVRRTRSRNQRSNHEQGRSEAIGSVS